METNYWDKKASGYDHHMEKSRNAYSEVIELIKKEINKSQTILDIGTGTGEIPIALTDNADKIIATDLSSEMINMANLKLDKLGINNIKFQVQDCYNISLNDEKFDVIITSNLLHILDKPDQFLKSIRKFLKKDGILIIPTFLHNENIKTKIISKILEIKGHPINTRFDSKSIVEFIEKCDYFVEKKVIVKSIMPMIFLVAKEK